MHECTKCKQKENECQTSTFIGCSAETDLQVYFGTLNSRISTNNNIIAG